MTKSVLARRSFGYVVGLCILPVGTLGFLAGFVSPYWHFSKTSSQSSTTTHGLWLVCDQTSGSLEDCQQTIIRAEDWLRGVQFLEVMALCLLLVACLLAILINCSRKKLHSRLLEIFAGFGATFAVFGSLCYLFLTLSPPDSTTITYNWGFGLNMAASVFCVIAAILIATNNAPPRDKIGEKVSLWKDKLRGPKSLGLYKPMKTGVAVRGAPVPRRADDMWNKRMWLLPPEMY